MNISSISLHSMEKYYYQSFSKRLINKYAYKMVEDGKWDEANSTNKSSQLFNSLLPDGIKSKKNHFFQIKHNNNTVGDLWIKERNRDLHILSIYIIEEKRSMGIGRHVMQWLEEWAKKRNFDFITLYVFIKNQSAIRFYKKLGFEEYDKGMRKNIKN